MLSDGCVFPLCQSVLNELTNREHLVSAAMDRGEAHRRIAVSIAAAAATTFLGALVLEWVDVGETQRAVALEFYSEIVVLYPDIDGVGVVVVPKSVWPALRAETHEGSAQYVQEALVDFFSTLRSETLAVGVFDPWDIGRFVVVTSSGRNIKFSSPPSEYCDSDVPVCVSCSSGTFASRVDAECWVGVGGEAR